MELSLPHGAQPSTSPAQEQDEMLTVDSDEEGPSNNDDISEEERARRRKLDEKRISVPRGPAQNRLKSLMVLQR